jgi:hypothetical protein
VSRGALRPVTRLLSRLRRTIGLRWGSGRLRRSGGSLDRAAGDGLESRVADPSGASLDSLFSATRSVRVVRGGIDAGVPIGDEVLFETDDRGALASLRAALRIVDGPAGQCACRGDPTLELLDVDGARLAAIGVHHGLGIRWQRWSEDAELADGVRLLEWLAFQGIGYPLDDYRQSERDAESWGRALTRWREVMPACLRPFSDHISREMSTTGWVADISTLQQAIERAHPDPAERALVLFDWFGHGLGPWSEFPAYESVAEGLLMHIPIADILQALDSQDLSETKLEGAARFLAGWEFRSQRRSELAQLPDAIRRRLLAHIQQSSSRDKLERARAAFDP